MYTFICVCLCWHFTAAPLVLFYINAQGERLAYYHTYRQKRLVHCPILEPVFRKRNTETKETEMLIILKKSSHFWKPRHSHADLSWSANTTLRNSLAERGQEEQLGGPENFCKSCIENLATHCISVWYASCTDVDKKKLQSGQHCTALSLPWTLIYSCCCSNRARNIAQHSLHPGYHLCKALQMH